VTTPRQTPLTRRADLHLPVRPGADLPIALAVIREMLHRGWADRTFLAAAADGVGDLAAAAEPWTIGRAATEAGVDPIALGEFAEWYGTTSPAVIRCGWGQERNRNGGASTMAILAMPAVGGKFGVRGGGYTMSNSSAWGIKAEALIDTPEPDTRLVNMNHLGRALTEYADPPVSVLFVYNCNPLATAPDQNRVRAGLERDDLFTIVHEQVLTDTARYADVILPAPTFLEQYDVAKGYGAYHLHLVQPAIAAAGEARPNDELFRALGVRLGLTAGGEDLGEAGGLIDAASRMPPQAAAAVLEGGPMPAPGGGRPIQFVDVHPLTPNGRIQLAPAVVSTVPPFTFQPDPATADYPLCLISPSSEQTISSTLGEFRPGIARVKIHPEDAHPRTIADGDSVRIYNALGSVECQASVTPEIRPGTLALPKGLWTKSTFNGSTANALVPDTLADLAGGACYNDARVEIELLGRH
jgi:anaerobic selenocysteine-containing dehydrogenase